MDGITRKMRHSVWWIVCVLWAAACTTTTQSPSSGWRPLSSEEVSQIPLETEPDLAALRRAVRYSIEYYERLPVDRSFTYGEVEYTAAEMIASHRHFLKLLDLPASAREQRLRSDFVWWETRNESGRAFFTGYYEPLLRGSLEPSAEFPTPLYPVPEDLLVVRLSQFDDALSGVIRGKAQGNRLVPYDDRNAIAYENSLSERAKPLVWLENDIELFFLQIQGSGVIELRDGSLFRVNYAEQNGHPYRAIGEILLDKIPREQMSLASLKSYLYENPNEVREILNYNPSYTFFRPIQGEGPLGNIEVPLTPERSIAMDHRLLPKGGLVFYETTLPAEVDARTPSLRRFALIQDTGGAIRGHGRADIFWGRGEPAARIAGPMKQPGTIYVFVARKEVLAAEPIALR
jgi:membrane-bound lytic murein transglycosylase A